MRITKFRSIIINMRFDVITIFPNIFDSYFNESMIKRAREKKLVDIRVHDLRMFTKDKYRKVDERPYGGGPGMVLQIEPLARALDSILRIKDPAKSEARQGRQESRIKKKTLILFFAAGGKQFDSKMAVDFAKKYNRIVMICGHYEGIDERVKSVIRDLGFMIQEISIGPYVLTGGEIPAMVVVDAVARHIPGVLGKEDSLEEKRHGVGVPVYTRPEVFVWKKKKYRVPKVLLSGDHKKINEWREKKK